VFGETLGEAVALVESQGSVSGTAKFGDATLPCDLWIGAQVQNPSPDSVVAVRTATGWAAVCAAEARDQATYIVERLHAKPSTASRKRVAVLDDEGVPHSICAHLEGNCYEARPFLKSPDLLTALRSQRFDGFAIDWIVGETSTLKVIASIRAHDAACPIIVLTAQMMSGAVDESEIAEAVATYNLVFSEKPVRMAILTASLARAFASK
jgi:CheY-like chemotaxis protein